MVLVRCPIVPIVVRHAVDDITRRNIAAVIAILQTIIPARPANPANPQPLRGPPRFRLGPCPPTVEQETHLRLGIIALL